MPIRSLDEGEPIVVDVAFREVEIMGRRLLYPFAALLTPVFRARPASLGGCNSDGYLAFAHFANVAQAREYGRIHG